MYILHILNIGICKMLFFNFHSKLLIVSNLKLLYHMADILGTNFNQGDALNFGHLGYFQYFQSYTLLEKEKVM